MKVKVRSYDEEEEGDEVSDALNRKRVAKKPRIVDDEGEGDSENEDEIEEYFHDDHEEPGGASAALLLKRAVSPAADVYESPFHNVQYI